ncbi:glycosyl transferase [Microbacterium binotii]|uniref:glycosyl transferase n=1 Tax=Microbacterium binotii TaxID=462710 RepID=UPI001F1BFA20|nr:glycosyl transferase [Microbacterium binotii]UIN32062.1 glycosyl transferase [Microbacterium binotii]
MRFVWAVAAFVLAALLIGAGIAQRTVFYGPSTQSAEIPAADGAAYTMVDGAVLTSLPGTQTLRVSSSDGVFVAYGRTADMRAWLSDQTYNDVTVGQDGVLNAAVIEPEVSQASAPADAAAEGDESATAPATTESRDPAQSDLWLAQYSDDRAVSVPLQLPDSMSVLIASDGTKPAPAEASITWNIAQTTPWAGPLMLLGGVALVAGIVLYVLAIRHDRRSRGPRRKAPPPLPETQPIDLAVEPGAKGVISASPSRRSSRRPFLAIPLVVAGALVFTGCSPDAWPDLAPTPTPSGTASIVDSADQQAPAVTEAQAQAILQRISTTVASADEARDANLAATRLDGAALAERNTNYVLRGALADEAALPPIPAEPTQIILPQAFDEWPRTVMAVVQKEGAQGPVSTIMFLTQADQWADYKLSYIGDLLGSVEMPDLAPAYIGASQVPPDSSFLTVAPDKLAEAYADVLNNGKDSTSIGLFDEQTDLFSQNVAANRQERRDKFNETGASTGTIEFAAQAGSQTPLALATLESGAIVAVSVNEVDTVTPNSGDVVIKLTDNPTVQALTGVSESATGVSSTFADQLFFYVPAQGSSEKIRLLGYTSNILEAKVL